MNILRKLRSGWKKLETVEKVGLVIDILCGVGSASMSIIAGNKMSEGRGIVERICIKTTMAGLGLAGGEIAGNALKENYAPLAAGLIDKVAGKAKPAEKKEDGAHE